MFPATDRRVSPIDMLIVDGPSGSAAPLAKLPALAQVWDKLSAEAIIVLANASRANELEVLRQWTATYPVKLDVLPYEGGPVVLHRVAPTRDR